MEQMLSEKHPLEPFLPRNARLLMLGSFPPQRKRWSMDFYYPNLQNDMWRIMGYLFYGDKSHFVTADGKHFDEAAVRCFCRERGIALSDTAREVIRQNDNASDRFLEVVCPFDPAGLFGALPECKAVAVTGQKAVDTFLALIACDEPQVGGSSSFIFGDRIMRLYRMPSSSRAFPRSVEWKSEFYGNMFAELGML